MGEIEYCRKKCCTITLKHYTHVEKDYSNTKITNKAGCFITDPKTSKILLVQSRGIKFGPPKGSSDEGESMVDCAIRETYEETGIKLDKAEVEKAQRYRIDKAVYFYIEMDSESGNFEPPDMEDNDATGITWIRRSCVGGLDLNSHAKKLINRFT